MRKRKPSRKAVFKPNAVFRSQPVNLLVALLHQRIVILRRGTRRRIPRCFTEVLSAEADKLLQNDSDGRL